MRVELLGLSGAGKSTLLRMVQQASSQEDGVICPVFEDFDIARGIAEQHSSNLVSMQKAFYDYRVDAVLAAAGSAQVVVSDFGLETDHKVYSRAMHESGYIDASGWVSLEEHYASAKGRLPPLIGRIFIPCEASALAVRIQARDGRPHPFLEMLTEQHQLLVAQVNDGSSASLLLDAATQSDPLVICSWVRDLGRDTQVS